MNIYLVSLCIGGLLALFGSILSWVVGIAKCNKQNISTSIYEGFSWALPPTLVIAVSSYSPYFLSIFSEPMKFFDKEMLQPTADMIGVGFAMMLVIFVTTTRLVHTTEMGVCKPTKDEMDQFQENLLKKLKEKQQEEAEEEAQAKKDDP